MNNISSRMLAAAFILAAPSTFAQSIADNYEFFYPKIKFNQLYPAPEGTTFKLTHVEKKTAKKCLPVVVCQRSRYRRLLSLIEKCCANTYAAALHSTYHQVPAKESRCKIR